MDEILTVESIRLAAKHIAAKYEAARDRLGTVLDTISRPANLCVGHSGGKDSVVVANLAHSCDNRIHIVHNAKPKGIRNETHPKTIEFLYKISRPVTYYPEGISHAREFEFQIDGTRAAESERLDRSSDLIVNGRSINRKGMGLLNKNGLFGMTFIYPIYDWTASDVWACIATRGLPYSDEYETEKRILKEAGF
jgi:3'-phosphoadenosine 5'-phosphosulfate sulfotransferase (PAPS reductase)/FAD synthetase